MNEIKTINPLRIVLPHPSAELTEYLKIYANYQKCLIKIEKRDNLNLPMAFNQEVILANI